MISHIAQRRLSPPNEESVRKTIANADPSAAQLFRFERLRRAPSLARWLGFGIRLLFAAATIAYFVVRYIAFVPRAIQP
jgi:hypothetical protein